MSESQFYIDEDAAIARCQRAYRRLMLADFREEGASWPIIPDRRWAVEEADDGSWTVSAYDTVTAMRFDEPPLVRWRVGRRLKRLV